jgi:hypothetical protein
VAPFLKILTDWVEPKFQLQGQKSQNTPPERTTHMQPGPILAAIK